MPGISQGHMFMDIGVGSRVQAVVGQKAVQVGPVGFGFRYGAAVTEEVHTGHTVEFLSQRTGLGGHDGIVVKEDVGAVESHVKKTAKPLHILPDLGGQEGKNGFSEPKMGVTSAQSYHLR